MAAVTYTHPNACIGRIPVRTLADVKTYTDKVIAFESDKKRVGKGRMIYTCPEASAYPKLGTSVKEVSKYLNDHSIDEFYAIKTPFDKDRSGDHDLSVKNWVDMINANTYELMHVHGHGLLQNWILEKHQKVTLKDVSKLTNSKTPLFLTTVSCFTGEYDSKKDPCIAEAMLRQPAGGALIVIAPSREGRPIFHNPRKDFPLMMREGKMDATTTTMTHFWKYALEENRTVGEAFAMVKADMIEDANKNPGYHFVQVELNFLGDPTLSLNMIGDTD